MNNAVFNILLIAFIIRLINLNQSLWLDEATVAKVVQTFTLSSIITSFAPTDFHPPFYYLFMKIWAGLFGVSEMALRLPSVLFSLAAGYMTYRIGRLLVSESIGLWSVAFFLFNPLAIYYSQEARMYMMATFFLMTATYYFLKLIQFKKILATDVIFCNLFILLSFVTFYGSAFFISGMYMYLLLKKKWHHFALIHPGFLLPFIILTPLLLKQLTNAQAAMKVVVNWDQVLGKATFKNLFLIPMKFAIGRISFFPKGIYYAISLPWTAFLWGFVAKGILKNRLLGFLLLFPLLLGVVFSVFSPLLQYFRFIYLVPIISILLALSVNNTHVKRLVLAGLVGFSLAYLLFPQFHREDWKLLSQSLTTNRVYAIPSSNDALVYYRPDVTIIPLSNIYKAQEETITVIPYTADIYGLDYQLILEKKQYTLKTKETYRGLITEVYTRDL